MMKPDGLIFDMDGTLWDAVDSYAHVWNATLDTMGVDLRISRQQLLDCMGLPLDRILERLLGDKDIDNDRFLELLSINEAVMMPKLGGTLYEGVMEGIKTLSKHYPLFMVSNCSAAGLPNFLSFTTLEPYFTDILSNGDTQRDKDFNIREIARRNGLRNPVYIGDTDGDAKQCRKAGIPFIHVTWGFGQSDDCILQVNSFDNLVKNLLDMATD